MIILQTWSTSNALSLHRQREEVASLQSFTSAPLRQNSCLQYRAPIIKGRNSNAPPWAANAASAGFHDPTPAAASTTGGTYRSDNAYVLAPRGAPRGIIHFLGGAFVGSAPELTYSLLMRLLSEGGYAVIATPYAVTFQHADCATAVQQDFSAALRRLRLRPDTARLADDSLPVFGVGHSNGALLHLLAGSLGLQRPGHRGDVLVSFNNREVAEAVPVPLSSLQPLVRAARLSPGVRSTSPEQVLQALAALAPGGLLDAATVPSLVPVLEQLDSILREVEEGAAAFSPSPEESRALVAARYAAPSTLLVRFADDSIDETPEVERILRQRNPSGVTSLRLPGTHVTPCGAASNIQIGRSFSPADAVALALRRFAEEDVRRLATQILRWLDSEVSGGCGPH